MSIIRQRFPTHMHLHELRLDSNKAHSTVEGHRLDNLPVPAMPWHPYIDLFFLSATLIIAK